MAPSPRSGPAAGGPGRCWDGGTLGSWDPHVYRPSLVLLQCLLLELYLILLPVFILIHWGMGLFCFCFLARKRLILKVLWDDILSTVLSRTMAVVEEEEEEEGEYRGRTMAVPSKKVFEVFVSKIPWTVAGKEMREYFAQFGPVKKCLLPFDKETGFHRGFCWVGFTTEEGLNNALQKDPHMLEGAKLQVQRNRRPFAGQKSNKDSEYD